MSTPNNHQWKYLDRKPGSRYRQLFVKGRKIAARTLYGELMNEEERRTVEEIAADWDLPLEAVQEAIAYCETDPPEIREDWEMEEEDIRAHPEYTKHLPK
jgi:uncharacterized protein (DUF433 family)